MLVAARSILRSVTMEPSQRQLFSLPAATLEPLCNDSALVQAAEDNGTLRALIREHLFISLFRACAESLASENASRLVAMERADNNHSDTLLKNLNGTFHGLRQSGIDAELFDVISGFKALSVEET